MSKWDDSVEAAVNHDPDGWWYGERRLTAEEVETILKAFALSAHGQTGPAALRDWVEGRAVLVPRNPTIEQLEAFHAAKMKPGAVVSDIYAAMLAASPAASDGETK